MKYAVLGAGAMGSIVGATLVKGGQEVVLVGTNKEHMEKVEQDGLVFTLGGITETVKMSASTDPHDVGPVDVVILLTKVFASEAALIGAQSLFNKRTYVCSLQNGLGNSDILGGFFQKDRILQGLLRVTGRMNRIGAVSGEILGGDVAIYIGSLVGTGEAALAAQAIAKHLTAGGLATEYKVDVEQYIWNKAVINLCTNAPCGILRLKARDYFAHPEGWRLAEDIAGEAVAVAAAKGIALDYDAIMAEIKAALPLAGDHYPSMAQDMKNKRKTEIDSLNGAIVRYGKELGIPTPANEYVAKFVKIIEENYELQF